MELTLLHRERGREREREKQSGGGREREGGRGIHSISSRETDRQTERGGTHSPSPLQSSWEPADRVDRTGLERQELCLSCVCAALAGPTLQVARSLGKEMFQRLRPDVALSSLQVFITGRAREGRKLMLCSDRARRFSNWSCEVAKAVHGNRSDNHRNRSGTRPSINTATTRAVLTSKHAAPFPI